MNKSAHEEELEKYLKWDFSSSGYTKEEGKEFDVNPARFWADPRCSAEAEALSSHCGFIVGKHRTHFQVDKVDMLICLGS